MRDAVLCGVFLLEEVTGVCLRLLTVGLPPAPAKMECSGKGSESELEQLVVK